MDLSFWIAKSRLTSERANKGTRKKCHEFKNNVWVCRGTLMYRAVRFFFCTQLLAIHVLHGFFLALKPVIHRVIFSESFFAV